MTALRAEVWVDTVTEGGRKFMAAWRKEEVDDPFNDWGGGGGV